MLNRIKYFLIGSPLPTQQLDHRRLNKIRALAAFSPDALSSIAYANQEIYLGLVVAGSAGLLLAWPIGVAITCLLIIVSLSYYQTISAYPSGGGSYLVARENLGTLAGLVAASALMIDYILTATVSITAGVEALASAFPVLWDHRVLLSLTILLVITLLNLRGLQETGTIMSIPVYLFLLVYLLMLAVGVVRLILGEAQSDFIVTIPATKPLSAYLVLHAFATGCTALTGIEAISNGVPYFQPPEAKNAEKTLLVIACLMGVLFLGSIGLTQAFGVVAESQETIISALVSRLVGRGPLYLLIQISTMLILTVAANTSFAGFPRLAAVLAGDKFLPRQLTNLGDRLVYSNGILSLSIAAAMLIVLFGGDTHALIPLFAVGVFLAFTLSQTGMVLHWRRFGGKGWQWKAVINALGALATAGTVVVVGVSKFVEGAWITILFIPILVTGFLKIRNHYNEVARELTLRGLPPSLRPIPPARVVIPISGVHRGIINAVAFAQSISNHITAVYVELEPGMGEQMRETWKRWWPDIPLVVVPSPYRSVIGPLLDFLDRTDLEHNDGQLATVILPEFVPARWWQNLLHNQTALILRAALLFRCEKRRGATRVIIDVPYHLRH